MSSSVIYVALLSRLVVFTLQAIFNLAIPDHNADAFRTPRDAADSLADRVVLWLFGGLSRWDAQYFLHIAEQGYTYEQTVAFFPLYPWLLRQSADIFVDPILGSYLSHHSELLISGVLLNASFFVVAAVALHELTRHLFSRELAHEAVLLFCFNPASIFFTACYTESLFSAISFSGVLALEQNRPNWATLLFVLGGLVRSNGFLSAGFLIYAGFIITWTPVRAIFRASLCFVPFLAFQCYAWSLFCVPDYSNPIPEPVVNQASQSGYRLAGRNVSEWCSGPLPFSYSYVQSRYWNVGFLKYYTARQIPNFALAMPVVVVVATCCAKFLSRRVDPRHVPYVLHAATLLVLCVLFTNVQVTTRLVAASSPVLYWTTFLAAEPRPRAKGLHVWADVLKNLWGHSSGCKRLIIYFVSYTVLGTAMHVNFLPWT